MDATEALRTLTDRITDGRLGDDAATYVLTGAPADVVARLSREHAGALWQYGEDVAAPARALYADPAALPPDAWGRWARVLFATYSYRPGTDPLLTALTEHLAHAHRGHAATSFTWRDLDAVLRADGRQAGALLAALFGAGDPYPGSGRELLVGLRDYGAVLASVAGWVDERLVEGDLQTRLGKVELVEHLADGELVALAAGVAGLATATSVTLQEAARPLVLRVWTAADAPLRTIATTAPPERRLLALRLLHEHGDADQRTFAAGTAGADRAAKVKALLHEWAAAGRQAAPDALPEVDWAVPSTPEVVAALAQVVASVDAYLDFARRHRGLDVDEAFVATWAERLRADLASAQPPREVLVDLLGQPGALSCEGQVVRIVIDLAPLAAVQVLWVLGLLRTLADEYRDDVAHRLSGGVGPGPGDGPTLLHLEAALDALGVDAPTRMHHALVRPGHRGLGDGWTDDRLAGWVLRHAARLTAEHDRDASHHTYDRRRFFRLVASVPELPADLADWVFARALDARPSDRPMAQAVLAGHPQRTARRVAALGDGRAEVRAVAARWLADDPDEAALPALEDAVRREQDAVATGAMLDALHALGRAVADYLDRDAMDAAAARAATKAPPAAVRWLDLDALPPVRWADTGATVPQQTVGWLVVQAARARSTEPGALLRAVCSAFEPVGRTALGDHLAQAWTGTEKGAAKGVLAVAAACGGERSVRVAEAFVREHHGERAAQSKALLEMLGQLQHPTAVEALVALAYRFKAPSIQRTAAEQVEVVAARRGWTTDEVGDRTVATHGFDETGRLLLDYGPRTFTAVLRPDLTVALTADDGTTVASLPTPRNGDDRGPATRTSYAAIKKALAATVRVQTARLREALMVQRTWPAATWADDLLRHPVLSRLASRLVWVATDRSGARITFRPLLDGSLTDVLDGEVLLTGPQGLAAGATVVLAHAVTTRPGEAEAWGGHLIDYEVSPLLDQLSLPGVPLTPQQLAATTLTDVTGAEVRRGPLRGMAEARGFTRGENSTWVRPFPALRITATLHLADEWYADDDTQGYVLGGLTFDTTAGAMRLADVPPVLLAEVRRDLVALGTAR